MTQRVHNKKNPFDVYIGRPSPWGNPFVIGKDGTREEVVAKHRRYLHARPWLIEMAQRRLTGKVLGCWCSPSQLCHGDNFIEVCDGIRPDNETGGG
jgi:hypothetical protein